MLAWPHLRSMRLLRSTGHHPTRGMLSVAASIISASAAWRASSLSTQSEKPACPTR